MIEVISLLAQGVMKWVDFDYAKRIRAIDALTPALSETIAYTNRLKRKDPHDISAEEKLFQAWYTASSGVSPYDKTLAKRCLDKSEYWLNSALYDDKKIDELNISLVAMRAELEKMKHP